MKHRPALAPLISRCAWVGVGVNRYPNEIELELQRMPKVADCACFST